VPTAEKKPRASPNTEICAQFKTTVCWYDELARSWPLGLSGGVSVALRLKKFGDPRVRPVCWSTVIALNSFLFGCYMEVEADIFKTSSARQLLYINWEVMGLLRLPHQQSNQPDHYSHP
jgi:hypothetical protein